MLDKNNKRMLAYVQEVKDVQPLFFQKDDAASGKKVGDEADAIQKAHVLGWTLVIKKGEFKPGDKCVFFEIDSKLPSDNPAFAFLENKKYCVQTYKLNKFGVIGQGLILPLEALGLDPDLPVGTDLTDVLKVTYIDPEDVARKADRRALKDQSKKSYMSKHKKFFGNWLVRKLMKLKFFRWLFLLGANGGKKDMKKAFPSEFVEKTDEERIQNEPWRLESKDPWVATEKIDGTSTTWLLVRKGRNKFEFYVCSRNLRLFDPGEKCYMQADNIYWENAIKYNAEAQLKAYLLAHPNLKWACIQGESYGEGWQGNPLKMKGHHFAAFNFKDSERGRWPTPEGKALLESWETPIPWVPILDTAFVMPDTVEELLQIATAKSVVNPAVLREGIVFRDQAGQESFKAVSPEYLMRRHQ